MLLYVLCMHIGSLTISPHDTTNAAASTQLVSQWLSLSLRNTSVGQRNKVIAVLTKLMQRIKVAAGAILHRAAVGAAPGGGQRRQRKGSKAITASPLNALGRDASDKKASAGAFELSRMCPLTYPPTSRLLNCLCPLFMTSE